MIVWCWFNFIEISDIFSYLHHVAQKPTLTLMRFIFSSILTEISNTLSSNSQIYQISEAVIPPPMVFNSSSLRSENPISRALKLNLFNELVELVRKMWAILSGRIPEWLILAETNLWEYFEDVRIGDGGAPGGWTWVRASVDLKKMLRPKKTSNNWKERIQMTMK